MAGSPLRRQRREERERLQAPPGARAQASDAATRAWALERAEQVGDEVAAREACVKPSTIRSWRRRARTDGSLRAPVPAVSGAASSAPSAPAVVADDDTELARAEAQLAQLRDARDESTERSRALQRAGNDIAAQAAARVGRDHSTACRAIAAEVALLREGAARLDAARAQRMVEVLEGFSRALGIPWTAAVRELLAALLRERGQPDIAPLAERASGELRNHFAAMLAQEPSVRHEHVVEDRAPEPDDALQGELDDVDDEELEATDEVETLAPAVARQQAPRQPSRQWDFR